MYAHIFMLRVGGNLRLGARMSAHAAVAGREVGTYALMLRLTHTHAHTYTYAHSGHFVAYVKRGTFGMNKHLYKFDDSAVTQLSHPSAFTGVLVALYERKPTTKRKAVYPMFQQAPERVAGGGVKQKPPKKQRKEAKQGQNTVPFVAGSSKQRCRGSTSSSSRSSSSNTRSGGVRGGQRGGRGVVALCGSGSSSSSSIDGNLLAAAQTPTDGDLQRLSKGQWLNGNVVTFGLW